VAIVAKRLRVGKSRTVGCVQAGNCARTTARTMSPVF
jgi:hypothetical protein